MRQQFLIIIFIVNLIGIDNFAQNTSLWGTLEFGGSDYVGSVYSIKENGEDFRIRYSFPSVIGEWPEGSLCYGERDTYYGIAGGGLHRGGVIFEYNSTNNEYKVLYNFNDKDGRFPQNGLIYYNNSLYGVTFEGGKYRKGTIFSFNLRTNSIVVLHSFNGKDEYSNIGNKTKLILYKNSLFGLTERGGEFNKGTLYKLNLNDSTFNTCINFDDNIGKYPLASLSLTSSGVIIGSTSHGISSEDGKIFKFDPLTSKFDILLSFDKVDGNFLQSELAVVNDTVLIGATSYGGKNGSGVLFEFNLNRLTYSPKCHLSKVKTGTISKGQLYKTTENEIYGLFSEGGPYNCGVLYKYDYYTKTLSSIVEFDKTKGYDFDNGVIFLNNNKIIGLAKSGGKNSKYGNIFSVDLSKNLYSQLLNFQDSPNGKKPIGDLISYKNHVYGVTQNGGRNDMGIIYRISISSNEFEKLIDFYDYNIGGISGGLCLSNNGKMYGFAGNSSSDYLPQIFYYEPDENKIVRLLQFGNDNKKQNDLSIRENNSKIVEKNKNGQAVIKYIDQPDSVDLTLIKQETDIVAYITKNVNKQYPFEKPIGTPLLIKNKLYGLFGINDSPRNGGIFCFDITTKNLNILEYFKSGVIGNLIYRNGYFLYCDYDGIIDSSSISSLNYFNTKKDRPCGHLNIYGDAIYYFPYTWDGLYRKSPKDSISQLIINFGIASPYSASRKKLMSDVYFSKKYDLARIFIKNDSGELIEQDNYNAIITGSVLKGPLLNHSKYFYGTTRAGGKYGSGIFFKFDPDNNIIFKLFDFPIGKDGYSEGMPSSLIVVKE